MSSSDPPMTNYPGTILTGEDASSDIADQK